MASASSHSARDVNSKDIATAVYVSIHKNKLNNCLY